VKLLDVHVTRTRNKNSHETAKGIKNMGDIIMEGRIILK